MTRWVLSVWKCSMCLCPHGFTNVLSTGRSLVVTHSLCDCCDTFCDAGEP